MTKNTMLGAVTTGSRTVVMRILGGSDLNSPSKRKRRSYKKRDNRLRKKQAESIHPYAKLTSIPPGFENATSFEHSALKKKQVWERLQKAQVFDPKEYLTKDCSLFYTDLYSDVTQSQQTTYELSEFEQSQIVDLLTCEMSYHPNTNFLYYVNAVVEDKVDATLRNEAIFNLRFLHNGFFTLSPDTFAKAVNLMDRFIVKVKVKPKYTSCVATACYYIAAKFNEPAENCPSSETLVQISRCGGTAADLERMQSIIESKLAGDVNGVTALDFVQAFLSTNTTKTTSKPSVGSYDALSFIPVGQGLTTRLLIALCSLEMYRFRPACLALAILLQEGGLKTNLPLSKLESLANFCEIPWSEVEECSDLVQELYEAYYRQPLPCSRGQLVWTLSRRTLSRMVSSTPTPLDTISEDAESDEDDLWLEHLFE